MAKKHRKLFPLLAETNKTIDCSTGLCDLACPYNCYSDPDSYTISPEPSPQFTLPPLSPSIPAVYDQSPSYPISPDTVIIITVASAVLAILLTGFVLAVKFASNRVNHVSRGGNQTDREDSEEEVLNREEVDHPIWYIRTTGLQQSIINSIAICRYKRGDGLIERTDCPICLNEFEEHESLRLLPKCNHAFHISCIDTWLRSHTNCPLCRAGVVSTESPQSSAPEDASAGSSGSGSQTENAGDGDGGEARDGDQSEDRAEPGRNGYDTALKDPMSSSGEDSLNPGPNSDAQMESFRLLNESDRNSEERPRIESNNRVEPEREDHVRVSMESLDPNLGRSISYTVTQMENSDLTGKSCQNQEPARISQSVNSTEGETETEFGEQASCSKENSFQSRRMPDSMDSGESNETSKFHSGISSNMSKPIGSSRFGRTTSSVFPL
ncbi:PREDICTED: RING-H2 finger protein ATL54 [Tarenaya hassleriana]|uniref:RING-H2 finger protein ATL54 n=1 Tax=Tarenaya hassleriana TaxID=28532 RepID=UPI00053C3E6E|nr:PREDICTED: RING-H2 finger protein ATL54 [Tarenaya hassleriana]